jgi:hypothetical protein
MAEAKVRLRQQSIFPHGNGQLIIDVHAAERTAPQG